MQATQAIQEGSWIIFAGVAGPTGPTLDLSFFIDKQLLQHEKQYF